MTGLELLREKLKERGCNKSTINSKAVAEALSVLSEVDSMDEYKIRLDIRWGELKLDEINDKINWAKLQLERYENAAEGIIEDAQRKGNALIMEGEALKKKVLRCETPEARDRMRLAEVFKDSVKVDSKYDNTAYIRSLGAILSGGKVNDDSDNS